MSYLAIYIVWGSTYLAIRLSLETLPMFFISTVRFLTAGSILILYARLSGCAKPTPANWIIATKSGLLSFFISFGLLTWAQRVLPSSVAALIISLEPAWFVILDWLCFSGKRPTSRIVLAQLIGFTGCALLIFAEPPGETSGAIAQGNYTLSALAVLGCGFAWVYGSLLSRSSASHPNPTMASGMQMFAGGVAFLAAATLTGDFAKLGDASLRSVSALAYLIVFGSLFAYSSYVFLLRTQPTPKVAAHTFVNPIVAVILGWAIAGERITPIMLVAAVLVVISVILTVYANPGKKQAR